MSRFTLTQLRERIKNINIELCKAGSKYHIEENGRNGYQAAGAYIGSCCMLTVGCGTSREVNDYCTQFYLAELNKCKDVKIKALESELEKLNS